MIADHATIRTTALALLKAGHANLSEAAELAGVSRQVVRYWVTEAGLDWQAKRTTRLRKDWRALLAAAKPGARTR